MLVGAYAAGALVGGLPGGAAAARLGARRAVLVGLALMGLASLGFAFAHGFWPLSRARASCRGAASGFTWAGAFAWLLAAAPRERRGELIGTALGAAVFGALFGPVVGAVAALLGRAAVFTALAGLAVVLGAWTLRIEPIPPEPPSFSAIGRALRNSRFLGGLALMALPSLLFGVLSTLAPLRLADAGLGSGGDRRRLARRRRLRDGASHRSTGRMLDRRGVVLPVQLVARRRRAVSRSASRSVPRPLAYVPLLIAASGAYGVLFTPAFALIADGAERSGLPQGMAFGLMNAAWATRRAGRPGRGRSGRRRVGRRRAVPRRCRALRGGACGGAARAAPHRRTSRRSDLAG